ncbi:MAG: carboxymuconolactone decarboxylase family protein [Streptosporangiaceae bacterium]
MPEAELAGVGAASRAASALDDALYYLRQGCEPCAQRYFDRARAHGATEAQIAAVLAAAASPAGDNQDA